jgi:TatD DNase family protein
VDVVSVYNLLLHENQKIPEFSFSAGLHPWNASELSPEILSRMLDGCAASQNLIAFGETGLDKACDVPMQLQQDVFELHLKKAVEHGKPLILHCVKAWDEIIEIAAGYPVIKILHGYNGSAQLTDRLLKLEFQFSIGKAILNPNTKIHQAIQFIPASSIFCETDTSEATIQSVYAEVSSSLKLNEEDLRKTIFKNFTQLRSA